MNIGIVGCGYVGLITAIGFALKEHNVVAVDIDTDRVKGLNNSRPPFFEPGLEEALQNASTLRFSETPKVLSEAEIVFICVGTPVVITGDPDLRALQYAMKMLGEVMSGPSEYKVIVVRSTVPPGMTAKLSVDLQKHSGKKLGKDFGLAMNPEFLQEGRALEDFTKPNRIVIGEFDDKSGNAVAKAYEGFPAPIIRTTIATAELSKLACNAFLATKISFINEIGTLCNEFSIDTYAISEIMGDDPRIAPGFLRAGLGFGGSCLPKDLQLLLHSAKEQGIAMPIIEAAQAVNKAQIGRMINLVCEYEPELRDVPVGVLGLAFKPGVSDIRESPALAVIYQLLQRDAKVIAYDPMANSEAYEFFGDRIEYADSPADVVRACDIILILTDWPEFAQHCYYTGKKVFDARRVLEPWRAGQVCKYYVGLYWEAGPSNRLPTSLLQSRTKKAV